MLFQCKVLGYEKIGDCYSYSSYSCEHPWYKRRLKFAAAAVYTYRGYISPADVIGNQPHLFYSGSGFAFAYMVVRNVLLFIIGNHTCIVPTFRLSNSISVYLVVSLFIAGSVDSCPLV